MRTVAIRRQIWPVRGSFAIARGSRTEVHTLIVEISEDGAVGRGECVPYTRYGETLEGAERAILALRPALEAGLDRAALQTRLPAGAARNAVDCALWDLQAKQTGLPVWRLAGLAAPEPVTTAYTLSLADPAAMGEAAAAARDRPLLKLKLTGGAEDAARVRAVRAGAPRARLIVDANEAWSPEDLRRLPAELAELGVALIEQPLPAGAEDALDSYDGPIPLCADESCHDTASLDGLAGRYGFVNIKLDKTGGLTEALRLRDAARAAGFRIMVGCMLASSLAMAPAHLAAQGAEIVDLDGPLLLAADVDPPLRFDGARIAPPEPALWG